MDTNRREAEGWFSAMTSLWPIGRARLVYGILWW